MQPRFAMRKIKKLQNTIIFGFDSAWKDNPDRPGAICAIEYDKTGLSSFHKPKPSSFSEAMGFIAAKEESYKLRLVALDQSLIVNNATGMRPVEKIAGSPIGWAGGGVQPSNRSRIGMFDDNAPIWSFKRKLEDNGYKTDDVKSAKNSKSGKYIMEVFPALGLLGLSEKFYSHRGAPKYNPEKRNFNILYWKSVCSLLEEKSSILELNELSTWANEQKIIVEPKKEDQDKLDAAICALIGMIWIACEDSCSMMIGNMETGYMITPVIEDMRIRLEEASQRHGIL